jgi:hypothetical protein
MRSGGTVPIIFDEEYSEKHPVYRQYARRRLPDDSADCFVFERPNFHEHQGIKDRCDVCRQLFTPWLCADTLWQTLPEYLSKASLCMACFVGRRNAP